MFNQGIYSKLSSSGSSGQGITGVVANYSALPSAAAAIDKFYFVENPQGTAWLPGSLGGTYYPAGLYYSNGIGWFYAESPYQATQTTVNTGTNTDQFVSPLTLANATTVERPLTFTNGLSRTVNTISPTYGTTANTITQGDDLRLTEQCNLNVTGLGSSVTDFNFCPQLITTSANMSSQRMYIPPPIYLKVAKTISYVDFFQDIQGVFTGSNFNGIGLALYSGGTATVVGSTANDENIWKGASSTVQSVALTAPYNASPGVYFLFYLWSSSATTQAPALGSRVNMRAGVTSFNFTNDAKYSSFVNSQTSLPASQAMSGASASNTTTFWGGVH